MLTDAAFTLELTLSAFAYRRLPSLVSKPRQAFGTPDSTERSYWASEKEEANGEMAGKEIWEVEDAVDDPGVGKPGRPISAGVRTAEVKKLQVRIPFFVRFGLLFAYSTR